MAALFTRYLPSIIFILCVIITIVYARSTSGLLVKRDGGGDVGDVAAIANAVEAQERIPGGAFCQELYPRRFTLDLATNSVIFSDRSLSRFINKRIPKGMVIDDRDSDEYQSVARGLLEYWLCVNQLALEGYTITGINRLDIRTLFRIGALSYGENVTKPGHLLAIWIALERDIHDTILPLKLLSSGPAYSEEPIKFTLALLRRLIPTRKNGTVNPIDDRNAIHEVTRYPFYRWKYSYAENEEEMLAKSVQVARAYQNAIRRWKRRKPDEINTTVLTFSTHAWVLAFQADNEVVLRAMLQSNQNIDSDDSLCAAVMLIKVSAFYHTPMTEFPRIDAWYRTLKNGTCPSMSALYAPNADELLSGSENQVNSSRPGGAACNGFEFETDMITKTVTFGNAFLSGYLNELLPPGKKIIQQFSLNYNVTRDGIQRIWNCINSLSRQNYNLTFSTQDIKRFYTIGTKRSSPSNFKTHPVKIFITQMINDRHFFDTSFAFALIRSGVLDADTVMSLVYKVMPTQLTYADPQLLVRNVAFVNEPEDAAFYRVSVGNMYYAPNDTILRTKSLELVNALGSGLVSAFKGESNTGEKLQSLIRTLVLFVKMAFFADNEIVLQKATRNEFIRDLAEKTGTLQHGLRNMRSILETYRIFVDDATTLRNLFLRFRIKQSDKELVAGIKNHPSLRSRSFDLFPRIKSWQETRD